MHVLFRMMAIASLTLFLAGCPMNGSADQSADSPRTPAEIRRDGNRLTDEPSLYLQQHAHNPIDWYPWGEAALSRARAEDKPIFLSIGYSSCHWCHVMEHEVFEHDDVAMFMNQHFICIKVDREERPDLDNVYMAAVQMMTGRGGWPMSVFLTPELQPFYGGTYFPHDQFVQLTGKIVEVYDERRGELEQQAAEMGRRIGAVPQLENAGAVSRQMITAAANSGKKQYDPTQGGFQQQQKFPTPVKWRFLLHEYRRAGDPELAEMIRHTCEAMAGGGIYDHIGGGFHRYTVDERWTVPHFEKMLYDNGQLASLYLEAGVVFERADFTAVGLDVLDTLLRDMRGSEGGFYSSLDADSGGEEGTYYIWSRDEISAVVGEVDGPVLADLLGVVGSGNFEHTGKSVLTWRADLDAVATKYDRDPGDLTGLLSRHRQALGEKRNERIAPGLDRKIITSWNGLTIAAMAQGYAVTGQESYLNGARQAADFLLKEHRRDDGSLWRASSAGQTTGEAILDDYAFLADGLIELYQVSGETRYLVAARELVDLAVRDFVREEGGYYLSRAGTEAPLGRTVDTFDSVIPSGNAILFRNLVRLAAVTGETSYLDTARHDLDSWSGLLDRAGLEMAGWFDAANLALGPIHDVVIAGDKSDEHRATLTRTVLSRLPAAAVLSLVPANGPDAETRKAAPALIGKVAIDGNATAYVCQFGTCKAPTGDAEELLAQVLEGWQN